MESKAIWSIGGGKGGIGKSVMTANIGCALARLGKKVVLVDADLGGANLHTYFGIKYPPTGLDDFLKGRIAELDEAMIETAQPNLRLICGAGEFLGIANPAHARKQKLMSGIRKLGADYIIVDLGAGSSYNTLDFFSLSSQGIVVLAPEPAAIQNAYIFLKSFVYRRLQRLFSGNQRLTEIIQDATDPRSRGAVKSFPDLCERIAAEDRDAASRAVTEVKGFRPRLLLNMASSMEDVRVAEAFKGAASTFLGLETDFVGAIPSRRSIKDAARKMRPFMLEESAVDANEDMKRVIQNLLKSEELAKEAPQAKGQDGCREKVPEPAHPAAHAGEPAGEEVFGFNENISHEGAVFHVQTEAQGGADAFIETIIYNGGRIFFSKRTRWKEAPPEAAQAGFKEFAARQHRAAVAAIKTNRITIKT
ncbi:MAG: P-loop NTPase [Deltaproteobacteria bacterium]|nr:P-loop NTPase [Deltaproteobacteria bacterium]MBZ0220066.1 P-loop NTPase [Deltaproteobacteria bacterium]